MTIILKLSTSKLQLYSSSCFKFHNDFVWKTWRKFHTITLTCEQWWFIIQVDGYPRELVSNFFRHSKLFNRYSFVLKKDDSSLLIDSKRRQRRRRRATEEQNQDTVCCEIDGFACFRKEMHWPCLFFQKFEIIAKVLEYFPLRLWKCQRGIRPVGAERR